jgi:F-type H+-transporting ATPase subunit epsilon
VADAPGNLALEVVTRTGVALREGVDEVQSPSVNGEFGVLPGHLPMLVALRSGVLSYRRGNETKRAVIGPGFAEVGPDKVLVLCEHWVPEDSIDVEAAREQIERERATIEKLEEQGTTAGAVFAEHAARLEWLEAQIALSELWAPGHRGRSTTAAATH